MDTENANIVTEEEQITNPFDNAIAIQIRQHRWGIRRKVREGEVSQVTSTTGEKVSKDVVSMNKALVDSREYDAILSLDNRIRAELEAISVPAMLERGTVLVALGTVKDARKLIQEYLARRPVLVDQFITYYETECLRREAERLGPLFRRDQYPSSADVRDAFGVDVRYRSFGVPGELKSVDEAAYEEAIAEVRKEMQSATTEIRTAMRAGLLNLVSHLQERLTATQDNGKPGKLHATAVENLQSWLNIFDQRNLTNDRQLRELVEQCKGVMEGISVDDLKKTTDMRGVVADALGPVKDALASLVEATPARSFAFDED